jgi:phosphate starvation-inducible protein PhoH
MASKIQKTIELKDIDPRLLFGTDHTHLGIIEDEIDVEITSRGDWINIKGDPENVRKAEKIVNDIIDHVKATGELDNRYILYSIAIIKDEDIAPSST